MPKYKIAFFSRGVPCHGQTRDLKPLGGTESALLDMSKALATEGQEVHVFTDLDRPGSLHEGVRFYPWQEFQKIVPDLNLDFFISVRHLLPLLHRRWAKKQIYFSPDAADQPFLHASFQIPVHVFDKDLALPFYGLKDVHENLDSVFCVGKWQSSTFQQAFGVPAHKIFIANNGVWPEKFKVKSLKERKKRLVYCSTPFRGLEYLIEYFPLLRSQVPELECIALSGMQLYGKSKEENQREYQFLKVRAEEVGIHWKDPVSKPELADILAESLLMAYPNTFQETFCIAALEAQAAGLPLVCTKLGGLMERVEDRKNGFLIPGHPSQQEYRNAFIQAVLNLCENPSLWEAQSFQARKMAEKYAYPDLARNWIKEFERISEARDSSRAFEMKDKIFQLQEGKLSRKLLFEVEQMKPFWNQASKEYGIVNECTF